MEKHTPGPWQYSFEGGTTAFITEADGSTIMCIRTIENSTGHRNLPANVQLIVASTDLLEALEDALDWIPAHLHSRHLAEAAIRKAKGEF